MRELLHERADMAARAGYYGCITGPIWFLHERDYMGKGIVSWTVYPRYSLLYLVIHVIKRFSVKIETDNLSVSNSDFISFDFTVSKINKAFEKKFRSSAD